MAVGPLLELAGREDATLLASYFLFCSRLLTKYFLKYIKHKVSNKSSEKWPWPNGKINKLTAENIQNCRINHVAISHLFFRLAMCFELLWCSLWTWLASGRRGLSIYTNTLCTQVQWLNERPV